MEEAKKKEQREKGIVQRTVEITVLDLNPVSENSILTLPKSAEAHRLKVNKMRK